ncbi:hypothetical protein M427DRAFT_250847 [Gonapodya prolifera JEL478]|uniref:Uncharacterized protein n=1 Tax=Gonapodya prolifera (strain JEL478) TaxID=1344416 RepID=A0A138ZXD1_GONPJ|nr:hypothetical protein M427DRAFT_250847 [Gonapodya prolifera JEL478]|eukprot:KXS09139.1 hypothetical protein M427DRAFT_250847 [Gonapodya prolifera JEL478]
MEALRAMSSPTARVVRSGKRHVTEEFAEIIQSVEDVDVQVEPSTPDEERANALEEALALKAHLDVHKPKDSGSGEDTQGSREPVDIPTGDLVIGDLVTLEEGVSVLYQVSEYDGSINTRMHRTSSQQTFVSSQRSILKLMKRC